MPRPVAFAHTNTHGFQPNLYVIPTQPHEVPLFHNPENHAPARATSTPHMPLDQPRPVAPRPPTVHCHDPDLEPETTKDLSDSTHVLAARQSLGLAPAVLGSLPAGLWVGRPRAYA